MQLPHALTALQLPGINTKAISSVFAEGDTLWITDTSSHVYQWKVGPVPVAVINGSKDQRFTNAMPISKNRAVVVDTNTHQFLIGTDGAWQGFASEGDQEGQLDKPVGAAWSKHGMIYIADTGNDRISVFSDTGLFLFTFGDEAEEGAEVGPKCS
jgi:hypothetical protein